MKLFPYSIKKTLFCLLLIVRSLFPTPSSAQGTWAWLGGGYNNTSYGTQGVPSAGNIPADVYEPCEWTDLQGNFWLFGGLQNHVEICDDLWKYDPVSGLWTWVKGPGRPDGYANYGTSGVAAASNQPPMRTWGVATWVDLNGDLWMYGGAGFNDLYGDLWRYNIASNKWTWINGDSDVLGGSPPAAVFGTKGVPSHLNTPGGLQECSATWVDADNNLWLFGGGNYNGLSNAVWRYSIATNEWTWMAGADTLNAVSVYGNKGVERATNTPGARNAYGSWKDVNGDFWLFGGYMSYTVADSRYDSAIAYNDMWRFSPASNDWTWMSGTNVADDNGNYGELCSSSVNYIPAARFENRARWTDPCGNFWMYSGARGDGFDTAWADLWQFNPTTLEWTLANNAPFGEEVFGTQGVPSAANTPGCRAGAVAWADNSGDFYVFGGSPAPFAEGGTNDMWKFTVDPSCPASAPQPFSLGNDTMYCGAFSRVLNAGNKGAIWSTGEIGSQITVTQAGTYWARVSCNSAFADTIVIAQVAGTGYTLGPDTGICPGGAITFNVALNNAAYLWSNGATASSLTLGDTGLVWVQVTQASCISRDSVYIYADTPQVSIFTNSDSICRGDTAILCVTGNFNTYHWNFGGNTACAYVTQAGNYYVTVTDQNHCTALSNEVNVTVFNASQFPITANGNVLSASGAGSYQWLLDGNAIPGATDSVYVATISGTYSLQTTDAHGCTAISAKGTLVNGIAQEALDNSISVFPNPTNTGWQLTVSNNMLGGTVDVFDVTGRLVYKSVIEKQQSFINCANNASGVYQLRISWNGYSFVRKLVRM